MSAPAQHLTVLLREAVEALAIKPAGVYVDATFGRGGHSRAILEQLGPEGRLLALDRDPRAIAAAAAIGDARLKVVHRPFADMGEAVREAGFGSVDGVLMDIGVSSPQLDEGERGFSFRFDAPLDMRMDTTQGETAAEWLARADVRDITQVVRDYGEERFAFQIAKKIVAARSERPVATTGQLAALVREAVRTREPLGRRLRALAKLEKKHCDLVVLNGTAAMNSLRNEVEVIEPAGSVLAAISGAKEEVARQIFAVIQQRLIDRPAAAS